jgi:hypothetical protein
MEKLSAEASASARDWGRFRAQELMAEMRELAYDNAMEFDANPVEFFREAMREVKRVVTPKG